MAEYKPVRKRNVEMSLPEHHESSLSVAMSGKPALPTTVCSPGRMVFASACRAVTTGAFLVCQARCNTGFVSLVAQIPLDCPEFHLGDLLARLPAETSLFLRIFLYAGGISDDQFGNVVGDTEIYRLTGSLVQQVPHPAVRGGLHPPLGGNQLSPPPASFLAAGKGIREPSQGFVPESFDGAHFPPGYDKTVTLFVTDGNGMDFADVSAGTDARKRLRFRVVGCPAENIPPLAPQNFARIDAGGRDKSCVERYSGSQAEDQGAIFSSTDGHLFEWNGEELLLPPGIANIDSLPPEVGCCLAVRDELVC